MLVKQMLSVQSRVRNVKIVSILAFGVILSAAATPAYAGQSQIHSNVRIKAKDLQNEKGVEKVYKRLQSQARKACAGRSKDGKPKPKVENICQGHLMDDYIGSVDDPALTEYHKSMKG